MINNSSSVLIVDDEAGIRTALRVNFSRNGWDVETASGVREASRLLENREFQLVVSDMRMPDGDGLEVMRAARAASSSTAVILLTAFGNVPDAVEAMRNGAFDYLTKPIAFDQIEEAAARVMQQIAPAVQGEVMDACAMVGRSPRLLRSLQRARAAANTDTDVLVEAESGTGKELLARFIHDASPRARKPFIAVNCAAVPEHLLESELFGHARGAFTGATTAKAGKFEMAHGGTLLLDEIGEMPLNLQPKLLRALQEREFERLGETRSTKVDIRVIATTNVDLASMVDEGKFRSDLYYRLNVIPLDLPPLRERPEDIELLARYFAEKFAARMRGQAQPLSTDFIERLKAHNWPGNVRELGNFMRRMCSLHPGVVLDATRFDQEFQMRAKPTVSAIAPAAPVAGATPGVPIRELERAHLESTLEMTRGNRTQAAEMLGISIRTMRNRIREYGLPQGDMRNGRHWFSSLFTGAVSRGNDRPRADDRREHGERRYPWLQDQGHQLQAGAGAGKR